MTAPVPVVLVRLLPGVPESLRVVHIVPVNLMTANLIVAYCGETFLPHTAERLDRLDGMPCTACMIAAAPTPGIGDLPTALPKRQPGRSLREMRVLLDGLRTTATQTIIKHADRDGRCPVCGCGSPCKQAALACHNFELLS